MAEKNIFAEKMVKKYEQLLDENAGVKSVSVDGQSVTWDDLQRQYTFWKKELDKSEGKKPMIQQGNLSNF